MKSADDFLAEYYQQMLPRLHQESKDIGRQSVHMVVWLVGLSVGIIVLILSKLGGDNYFSAISTMVVIILFSIVIVSGVLQRFFYHIVEVLSLPLMTGLQGYFMGLTTPLEGPSELQEDWDRDEIVRRIKVDFGVIYDFLIEYNVPLEGCQKAYVKQYDIHKKFELEGIKNIAKVIAAYTGLPKEETEKGFLASSDDGLTQITSRAKTIRLLSSISNYCFYATAISFIVAVLFIVISVIRIYLLTHGNS